MRGKDGSSHSMLRCFKYALFLLVMAGLIIAMLSIENEESEFPSVKAVGYWLQMSKSWSENKTIEIKRRLFAFGKNTSSSLNLSSTLSFSTPASKPITSNSLNSSTDFITTEATTSTVRTTKLPPTTPVSTMYYDYTRTKQWGKQNETAWRMIYGDTNCADNGRRVSLTAITKKWVEIATKHNIKYAYMWGSLMGILRNNDVIPWDHDADLLVEYKDILLLEKLGWPRSEHPYKNDGKTYINAIPSSEHNKSMDDRLRWDCHGKLTPRHVDLCAIQEPLVRLYNNGAFLDVFHYYDLKDTILTIPEGHRLEMKRQDFYPLRECLFMGVKVSCPNNPVHLLSEWYGKDFMKSPKTCKNGRWV